MEYKVDIRKAFQWGSDCLKRSREREKEMKRRRECMQGKYAQAIVHQTTFRDRTHTYGDSHSPSLSKQRTSMVLPLANLAILLLATECTWAFNPTLLRIEAIVLACAALRQ